MTPESLAAVAGAEFEASAAPARARASSAAAVRMTQTTGDVPGVVFIVSTLHQHFDLVGFDGDVGHQIDVAVLAHQDRVFQADGETLFANVNARLDGDDPARADRFRGQTHIVHVQTDRVADAVHEIFLE